MWVSDMGGHLFAAGHAGRGQTVCHRPRTHRVGDVTSVGERERGGEGRFACCGGAVRKGGRPTERQGHDQPLTGMAMCTKREDRWWWCNLNQGRFACCGGAVRKGGRPTECTHTHMIHACMSMHVQRVRS